MTPSTWLAWPLALFAVVFLAHTHGNMGCADSRWSIFTAVSLIDQHNADLDEYLPTLRARGFFFTEQVGGHYYTVYPLGASIVAAPAVAILRPIAGAAFRWRPSLRSAFERGQWERGCGPAGGEPILDLHSWTEQIVAAGVVAAAAVVVYAIARAEVTASAAAMVALLFAFGTSAWSTASRSLWQHGPLMLVLAVALLVQVRGWPLIFLGLALGFSYVVRPTAAVPLAIGTAWVALQHPRRVVAYAAGVGAVLAPFFLYNLHVYGTWLPAYYRPASYGDNPFVFDALAGSLISPGRGLFVYSPIFLFVPIGMVLRYRGHGFDLLDASLAASIVVHAAVTAWVNPSWWGGYSYGPRFFTDIVPYLMYFLVPVVAWIGGAPRGRTRRTAAALFAISCAASVAIHAQGALNPLATGWNVTPDDVNEHPIRLWSWRRPPFLAGLQRDVVPPDLNAVACAAPPGAPSAFAVVSNARHTLVVSWRPATDVPTEFVIESGTAAGLHNFPDRVVDTGLPTLTLYPVRPGTYFGRVRARNACGVSAPSNEIAVTVR